MLFTRDQRDRGKRAPHRMGPRFSLKRTIPQASEKPLLQPRAAGAFPAIHERLLTVKEVFEARAKRPLDIEFTVENHKLYLLQRRPLRMTSSAALRSMWDFVDEGKTSIQLASMIINTALEQSEKSLRCDFTEYQVLARGEPITDTADSGTLVFGTEAAIALADRGEDVIMLGRRPFGETEAVNHPLVRGIVRYEGNITGHEAVSAVAYSKPYSSTSRMPAASRGLLRRRHADAQPQKHPSPAIWQKESFVDRERETSAARKPPTISKTAKAQVTLRRLGIPAHQFDEGASTSSTIEALAGSSLIAGNWSSTATRNMQRRIRDQEPGVTRRNSWRLSRPICNSFPSAFGSVLRLLKEVTVEDFDSAPS